MGLTKSVLDLEPKSVVRRMKDKAFARGVKWEDLVAGAELLQLPFEEHVGVIGFLRERAVAGAEHVVIKGRVGQVRQVGKVRPTPYLPYLPL